MAEFCYDERHDEPCPLPCPSCEEDCEVTDGLAPVG